MNNELNGFLENEQDTQKGLFLTWLIGSEIFALEIKFVTEIVGIQPVTHVPEVPHYVKGIINLRGKIVPVIDMRLKFNKTELEYNDRTCIIVVEINDICVGLIVDKVEEVVAINDENICAPPDYKTGINNRYVKGIGLVKEKVILILDCLKLLSTEELDEISQI